MDTAISDTGDLPSTLVYISPAFSEPDFSFLSNSAELQLDMTEIMGLGNVDWSQADFSNGAIKISAAELLGIDPNTPIIPDALEKLYATIELACQTPGLLDKAFAYAASKLKWAPQ